MDFKGVILGLFAIIIFHCHPSAALTAPDPALTPGELCTPSDPNFSGYDYPEHVARCRRNIMTDEKLAVARSYGDIPQANWPEYEFDHLIPLCAGGSNDIKNLWPQPIAEAHQKDTLENDICIAMKAGTMTQAQAVQKVHDWFQNGPQPGSGIVEPETGSAMINCTEAAANGSSMLTAHFDIVDQLHINHVSLDLLEDTEHEIINSADNVLQGKPTRTKSGPLAGLNHFSIKDNSDRFDLYLSPDLTGELTAYVKISFEDTFPKLTKLNCVRGSSVGK